MTINHKTQYCRTILSEPQLAAEVCLYALRKFQNRFPNTNPTLSTTAAELDRYSDHEGYKLYNFFSTAAPSQIAIRIFHELIEFIFMNCDDDRLYVQAWLNCQKSDQLLDWHRHNGYLMHGYICIDPKDTFTEFESFKVENKLGLMYIGECGEMHRVIKQREFTDSRLTIGFDVIRPSDREFENMGFIPIYRNTSSIL